MPKPTALPRQVGKHFDPSLMDSLGESGHTEEKNCVSLVGKTKDN